MAIVSRSGPLQPKTLWCGPSPFRAEGAASSITLQRRDESQASAQTRDALIELLTHSLKRGHWRVALRRFAMLANAGFDVPVTLKQECDLLAARLSPREMTKMVADARAWTECLSWHPDARAQS
jgi:hypothetical protein